MSASGNASGPGSSKDPTCFNCGETGHWAIACPEPTRKVPAYVFWFCLGTMRCASRCLLLQFGFSLSPYRQLTFVLVDYIATMAKDSIKTGLHQDREGLTRGSDRGGLTPPDA